MIRLQGASSTLELTCLWLMCRPLRPLPSSPPQYFTATRTPGYSEEADALEPEEQWVPCDEPTVEAAAGCWQVRSRERCMELTCTQLSRVSSWPCSHSPPPAPAWLHPPAHTAGDGQRNGLPAQHDAGVRARGA